MLNCPKCKKELTDDQVKSLCSARTSSMRTNFNGGPKITCDCGECLKCKRRASKIRSRLREADEAALESAKKAEKKSARNLLRKNNKIKA